MSRTQMNRTRWNELADDFETQACDIAREETKDRLGRVVDAARPSPERSVLVDLGCGLGSFVRKYQSRFAAVTAVEFAPRIIARAKKNCARVPNVRWLTLDIPRSAKTIGTIADLTVCMNVITAPNRAKRDAIWAAIAHVTKPGGFALIVVPSLESERMVQRLSGKSAATSGGLVQRDDAVQKHFERRELADLLPRFGFAAKRIARIYYPWAKEGMRKPRGAGEPWDWLCLAQRSPVSSRPASRGPTSKARARTPRSGSPE